MTNKFYFYRPQTLKTGGTYLYQERNGTGYRQSPTVIRFLDYDPCPAIVIIQTLDGCKERCLREELFLLGEIDQQEMASQFAPFFRYLFQEKQDTLK